MFCPQKNFKILVKPEKRKQTLNKAGKIILLLTIMLCLFFSFSEVGAIEIRNPLRAGTFRGLVEIIIDFFILVAVIVAPLMIIVGAFYFVVSAGNPEQIATGRKIITYTLIGLVLVLLARGLIWMLREILIAPPAAEQQYPAPLPREGHFIPWGTSA